MQCSLFPDILIDGWWCSEFEVDKPKALCTHLIDRATFFHSFSRASAHCNGDNQARQKKNNFFSITQLPLRPCVYFSLSSCLILTHRREPVNK